MNILNRRYKDMHKDFPILDYIQDNKLTDDEPDQIHNKKDVGFVVL